MKLTKTLSFSPSHFDLLLQNSAGWVAYILQNGVSHGVAEMITKVAVLFSFSLAFQPDSPQYFVWTTCRMWGWGGVVELGQIEVIQPVGNWFLSQSALTSPALHAGAHGIREAGPGPWIITVCPSEHLFPRLLDWGQPFRIEQNAPHTGGIQQMFTEWMMSEWIILCFT